jgi:hypothetical protein
MKIIQGAETDRTRKRVAELNEWVKREEEFIDEMSELRNLNLKFKLNIKLICIKYTRNINV